MVNQPTIVYALTRKNFFAFQRVSPRNYVDRTAKPHACVNILIRNLNPPSEIDSNVVIQSKISEKTNNCREALVWTTWGVSAWGWFKIDDLPVRPTTRLERQRGKKPFQCCVEISALGEKPKQHLAPYSITYTYNYPCSTTMKVTMLNHSLQ